jgi:hypothetical protein
MIPDGIRHVAGADVAVTYTPGGQKTGPEKYFPGPACPISSVLNSVWFYWLSCNRKNWLPPVTGTATWLSEPLML